MRIPQFDPINTVQDLVNQNVTIFDLDFMFDYNKEWYLDLNISEWKDVANTMVPADGSCWNGTQICANINGTWEYFIKYHLHGDKTHAIIAEYLYSSVLEVMTDKKNWWRSNKLEFGLTPYAAVLTSRNWILNEVMW